MTIADHGNERLAAGAAFLFVPAHEPAKVARALATTADVVILDLEDAVPGHAKERARAHAAETLTHAQDPASIVVRINPPATPEGVADISAISGHAPAAIVVPKADTAALCRMPEHLPIVALVETASGLADARAVARDPRVERLMLGSLDLAVDLGLILSPGGLELAFARSELALASRLATRPGPIDGVYPRHRDSDGLRREAQLARNAGMRAKACIHPAQLAIVAAVFSTTPAELAWADRVLAAWEADHGSSGVIDVEGEMVDAPVVQRALRVRAAYKPSASASALASEEPS